MQKQVTLDSKLIDISFCINDLHAHMFAFKKFKNKKGVGLFF
jgi:hypothetical protein